MATNNIAAAPNPYADDQLAIDRRRRIAEALSEQSAEPMGAGGMVGNVYVGPSWTQGLAKLFQGYVGGQAMKAADQQQRELNQRRMGNYSRTMSDVTKALMGGQTPGPVVENQPGDPMLAYQIAMNSGDPMAMQNLGTLLQLQRDMRPSLKFHNAGGEVFVVDDKTGQITKMPMAPTPGEMRQQDEFKYRVNQDQWNANNLSLSQATEAQARNAEADAARETAYFNTGRRASPLPTVPPFVPRPAWNPQTGFGASPPVAPVQTAPAAQPSQPRAAVPPQAASPAPSQAVGRAPVATPAPAKAAASGASARDGLTPKQRTELAKAQREFEISAERRWPAQIDQIQNVMGTVDRAIGQVGYLTSGLGGSVLGKIPGTDARDLQSSLETVKANLGFSELQKMRDASPTGGALGQVAVQELQALQAAVQSLDRSQSPDQLRENLARVRKHYVNWANNLAKAANQPAPKFDGASQPAPKQPAPKKIDGLLDKYAPR